MIDFPVFTIDEVVQLNDGEYLPFILGAIRSAKTRVLGSVFIVDTVCDSEKQIRQLIKTLAYARWRFVDVRLLIGDSDVDMISICNGTSRRYGESLDIPVHTYSASQGNHSLHSKYVVIDEDLIVIGSHNWTSRAFSGNREGSVAVRSVSLARILSREFWCLWKSMED